MNEDVHGDRGDRSTSAVRSGGGWRAMGDHGPATRWKVVSVAVPGILFALLDKGVFSRSVYAFAWTLFAYMLVVAGLLVSEVRRWVNNGYFQREELLTTVVAVSFSETLLVGALLADVLVERHPLALTVSVVVILLLLVVCDLLVAARIGQSESNHQNSRTGPPDGEVGDEGGSSTEAALVDGEKPDAAAHVGARLRKSWWLFLDLLRLGVVGAGWVAPVAVIGALGIGSVVWAAGGLPKAPRNIATSVSSAHTAGGGSSSSGSGGGPSGDGGAGSDGSGSSGGGETSPRSVPWNGPCTEEARGSVSETAFDRMVQFFKDVRLEPHMEGCISELEGHPYPHDYYVTAVGVEQPSKEPLSYAIQSEQCGGAMVLNNARGALEEVVEEAGPVCGANFYPRYFFGVSDYYYLLTAHGVYFLYRRSQSDEYEVIPPGLVRTWYQAMLAVKTWLTPSPPRYAEKDTVEYQMWSPRNTERPELTVTFNKETDTGSYPGRSFGADVNFEPSLGMLLKLAGDN